MEYTTIRSYKDLIVWQEAHRLALLLYKVTKKFPREELYSLVDQIRRAAVSITSNIAEGFSRQSTKEKIQFYYLSLGSLTEVDNQITLAKDLGYISPQEFEEIVVHITSVHKLLNRFIASTKLRLPKLANS